VSESLGTDPTEVFNALRQLPVHDTLDTIDEPQSDSEPHKPRREGLPPSFRMRHDKHYVEELISAPPITQVPASAPSPRPGMLASGASVGDDRRTPAEVPCPSAAAIESIARRLESIVAHGAVSRADAGSMDLFSRTVGAELQRVSRFARAVAVSARQIEAVRRSVPAGEIATAIRSACTRVARLNGVECVVATDDPAFAVAADRALIVHGIVGTVDAFLDLMHVSAADDSEDEGARIAISLKAARLRPALIVDIECPTLAWRGASTDRFFENNEQDFARAPDAGILLASAAHAVRLHGGRVEVQLRSGVHLRYVFPGETPRATAT